MIGKFVQLVKSFSKTERYLAVGAAIVFAVSFVFWSISFFYNHTIARPAYGGGYIEGVIGQPVAVNPLIAAADADLDLAELLFADLVDLIENIEVGEDRPEWIFSLKPDLQWSDGESLTSDDVVFTIEIIQNSDARSPLFATWQGVGVERLSERQFRLSLKTPYAFFESNFKKLKVVPEHIFGGIPAANLRLSNFNLEPVASGPFKFAGLKKRKDGFITDYFLTRNDSFSGDRPYLENFNFKFFSNKESLLGAFNKREILGFGGIDHRDLEKIKIGNRVFKMNIPSYYAIFLNQAFSEALRLPEVRAALAQTTDKKRIVSEVFGNNALIIDGPLVPYIEGYDAAAYAGEVFSVEKANELLDKNGWKINEAGIRSKIIGRKDTPLDFNFIVPQVEFLAKTAEILKEDWKKIGVNVTPIYLHPQDVTNDIIKARNYQMLIFGTILKATPDIFSFWHSSERFYPGSNLALFNNKTADRLLEAVKADLNPETRLAAVSEIQKLIVKERPAIFLYSPAYFYVSAKNLGGFEEKFIPTRPERFADAESWYLKVNRSFK